VPLKYQYPQTLQLALGSAEYISIDVQHLTDGDNERRYTSYIEEVKKPNTKFTLLFMRKGDYVLNVVHSLPAQASIDDEGKGSISATWSRVDIPTGKYDMYVLANIPQPVFFRKDSVEVI